MATNKPLELYFTRSIHARGEHVVGENAVKDDGKVNMVLIRRGETKRIHFDAARDLIVAKQALDVHSSKPADLAEAKRENQAHDDYVRKMDQNEKAKLLKAA